MLFYKALFKKDLIPGFIPGTVTSDVNEAYKWFRRYKSKKKSRYDICGRGSVVIIRFNFDETTLLTANNFQLAGVSEHNRLNCWTSSLKVKAQINTVVDTYTIVNINTVLNKLY